MKDIQVQEVIISNLKLLGSGVHGDPYRRATEVYSKDGDLIASNDPESILPRDAIEFAKFCAEKQLPINSESFSIFKNQ